MQALLLCSQCQPVPACAWRSHRICTKMGLAAGRCRTRQVVIKLAPLAQFACVQVQPWRRRLDDNGPRTEKGRFWGRQYYLAPSVALLAKSYEDMHMYYSVTPLHTETQLLPFFLLLQPNPILPHSFPFSPPTFWPPLWPFHSFNCCRSVSSLIYSINV